MNNPQTQPNNPQKPQNPNPTYPHVEHIQCKLTDGTPVGIHPVKFTTPTIGYFRKHQFTYRVTRPHAAYELCTITHETSLPGSRLATPPTQAPPAAEPAPPAEQPNPTDLSGRTPNPPFSH